MKNVVNIKAKISSQNRLTIPKAVRELLKLTAQDKVVFQLDKGVVTLKKDTEFWDEVREQERVYGNLDRKNRITSGLRNHFQSYFSCLCGT